MTRSSLLILASAFAAAHAVAGPYDQVYSIIVTDKSPSADFLLRPVLVNRVDGENALNNEAIVAPGRRSVVVDLPPRKGSRLATQHTLDLTVAPCTRYFVVAKLKNSVGQDWVPHVRRTEAIGECEAKFKVRSPAT